MGKPIICIDFDGVIHSYNSGWKGASVIPDPPVNGALDALFRLLDAGYDVAIYSSRSKNLFGRWAMQRWLADAIGRHWERGGSLPISKLEAECWGDAAGVWRRFKWPWFKPSALLTIDDRAVTFNGNWAEYTPDMIRAFKPWNKKPATP